MDIAKMKLKWIIEYFSSSVVHKCKVRKMIGPLLDIASQTKDEKYSFKKIGNLKVVLKHCEIKDVHSVLSETISSTIMPEEK